MLAIECIKTALPQLPLLRPLDLMEFRAENEIYLNRFRRAMMRYAADINSQIGELDADEVQKRTTFFVETEIVPSLEELREAINAPARAWYKRAIDGVRIIPSLAAAAFVPTPGNLSAAMGKVASVLFTELEAKADQAEKTKRAGLLYLLRLEAFKS